MALFGVGLVALCWVQLNTTRVDRQRPVGATPDSGLGDDHVPLHSTSASSDRMSGAPELSLREDADGRSGTTAALGELLVRALKHTPRAFRWSALVNPIPETVNEAELTRILAQENTRGFLPTLRGIVGTQLSPAAAAAMTDFLKERNQVIANHAARILANDPSGVGQVALAECLESMLTDLKSQPDWPTEHRLSDVMSAAAGGRVHPGLDSFLVTQAIGVEGLGSDNQGAEPIARSSDSKIIEAILFKARSLLSEHPERIPSSTALAALLEGTPGMQEACFSALGQRGLQLPPDIRRAALTWVQNLGAFDVDASVLEWEAEIEFAAALGAQEVLAMVEREFATANPVIRQVLLGIQANYCSARVDDRDARTALLEMARQEPGQVPIHALDVLLAPETQSAGVLDLLCEVNVGQAALAITNAGPSRWAGNEDDLLEVLSRREGESPRRSPNIILALHRASPRGRQDVRSMLEAGQFQFSMGHQARYHIAELEYGAVESAAALLALDVKLGEAESAQLVSTVATSPVIDANVLVDALVQRSFLMSGTELIFLTGVYSRFEELTIARRHQLLDWLRRGEDKRSGRAIWLVFLLKGVLGSSDVVAWEPFMERARLGLQAHPELDALLSKMIEIVARDLPK